VGLCGIRGAHRYNLHQSNLDQEIKMEAICPSCGEDIEEDLEDMDIGDELECPECLEWLEVVSLAPLQLRVVQ
jgi:lysine biosynthesis protein LysW